MTTLDKQYHVPGLQNTAFKVFLFIREKINPQFALFDKQYLLGIMHLSQHGIVDVRLDGFPRRMFHKRQLLRQVVISKEMYPRFIESFRNYESQ